jgi:hypothetical protein
MKLLTLLTETKKGKYKASDVFRLYMPNGGEDGVLIGWRADWPDNHYIEFRGLPYSQWTHDGDDFQRVHDRLHGMRATVLHHNSIVEVLPHMKEHGDIATAINGGELPPWDKDRAFNEDVYHATGRDVDQFHPLSHFGTAQAAKDRARNLKNHPNDEQGPLRTYRAKLDIKNPVYLHDYGESHSTAYDIADGIMDWYRDRRWALRTFSMRGMGNMMRRWGAKGPEGIEANDVEHRKELISFLKAAGHDGIEYENDAEDAGSASYMNLDPVVAESAESIYDDGSVRASIEEWEGGVAISELSSYNSAEAGQAVKHLKQKYGHVTVSNIGERDTESYTFWMRALKRGLVDDAYLPNGERATPYSTQAGVTIKYNGQPKVGVMPQRSMNDSTVMMLPTAAMDDAFKRGGAGFYVGPDGSGASIGKRYETFQQWIAKYDQYELPEVSIRDNGILNFTNGRHRYAVFRDAGVDPMPVAMSNESVPNAKRLGGVIRESIMTEMADPKQLSAAVPKALAELKGDLIDDYEAHEIFMGQTGIEGGDPKYAEQFAVWKEGYAQRLMGETIGILNKSMEFRNGMLMVYRMYEVGSTEEFLSGIATQGLGYYWSWTKDGAIAYDGPGGHDALVTGAVDPKYVEWVQTLVSNAGHGSTDEREVLLPEGAPIKILNIELNGESVDPSLYGGRGRTLMSSKGITESQLDDDYARGYYEGQIEGIKAGKEYSDSPQGRAPEYENFHVTSGRVTKANGYEKAYAYGYQDGYYTMLTGGDAEYLIGKITAKLAGNVS